jgi:hypothetical protein
MFYARGQLFGFSLARIHVSGLCSRSTSATPN